MDDSFAFQGSRDPRQLDPRAAKFAAAAFVVVLVAGLFVRVAVASERTSFRRLQAANVAAARQATLQARQLTVAEAASQAVAVPATAGPSPAALEAQHVAFAALRAAKAVHRVTGTFAGAGPGQLSTASVGALLVDGPSTEPQIVSVSASSTAWAAAVMSSEGVCYYVRVAPTNAVRYGTGVGCTGTDAMHANGSAW